MKDSIDFLNEFMFRAQIEESKNNKNRDEEGEKLPKGHLYIRFPVKFSPVLQGHILLL